MDTKVNNLRGENHPKAQSHTLRYPTALSIAGSDSSAGAGIQADLKTFSALGVYGATAITAITAQNTEGVVSQCALPADIVRDQIVAVIEDIRPSVIKIGMLHNRDTANIVADTLERYNIPIILDPVMVSTSGHRLLSPDAEDVITKRLLPMAMLITPNIPEMAALTAMPLTTLDEKRAAACSLLRRGAKAILLKGGHEEGNTKIDILYQATEKGMRISYFASPTIATRNTHGTGCTLSAAIASYIALGYEFEDAVAKAKSFISSAIEAGQWVTIGKGHGPVNHMFNPQPLTAYEEL